VAPMELDLQETKEEISNGLLKIYLIS